MDFIDQLKLFATRAGKMKDQIQTEEATKTSLIMPFFQLLGYDVFNPLEFVPEFTADVGIKKGEKVDYAIMDDDGAPVILIEAKWSGSNLDGHDSQLFRYFSTTKAKFAILTNGILYKFYTDLDSPNVMDDQPFFEVNLFDIKDAQVPELKKFQKSCFDMASVFDTASELKYSNQIKLFLSKQFANPSDSFVAFILGEIYEGRKTANILERFRGTVQSSFSQFMNDTMNDRIKAALDQTQQPLPPSMELSLTDVAPQEDPANGKERKIVTTMEELEGLAIVKAILRGTIDPARIFHRDTESYFGILIDDNKLKWVCRLQLESNKKYLVVQNADKSQSKVQISSVNDLFDSADLIVDATKRFV